ncbi:MAG: HAMP domain-containing histidine kinase, partial [Muribaculaceae bacterium]|nr:HAMP domain-containing histidine kinase [Muribaculaceae bacterium]
NRVIQNLISNGIKYTSGDVFFYTSQENGRVILTVSNPVDTDIDTARIFDKFYMQDKSRSRGSGIGLYLCRQFMEAMGGSISAELNGGCLSVKVMLSGAV